MPFLGTNILTDIRDYTIFSTSCEVATFSVTPSSGSIFTLLVAIDAQGDLVADPVYTNYTYAVQDFITKPGKFIVRVIQPGTNGIRVQCKTF